jgi:NAD(P) transhydrogenase
MWIQSSLQPAGAAIANPQPAGSRHSPAERGLLKVDSASVPKYHIYAVGDVIGFPALASTSMEQAGSRWRMHSFPSRRRSFLASHRDIYDPGSKLGRALRKIFKSAARIMWSEALYRDNSRGTIIGDRQGFLKLLFQRSDMKLVGVHVIGELATEIVHIGMITMLCGGGAAELNEACFNIPTLGDLYKIATYRAQIARDRPEILNGR